MNGKSLDRILAGMGILLTVPGFAALFLSPYGAAAAIALTFGALFLAAAAIFRHLDSLPPYTYLDLRSELLFPKGSGAFATFKQSMRIRPNFRHLTMLTLRGFGADGTVTNFKWDGKPVDVVKRAGRYRVTVTFTAPRTRFVPFSGILTYDFIDSFLAEREYFCEPVRASTKRADLVIGFPEEKPGHDIEVIREDDSGDEELPAQMWTHQGRQVSLQVRRPKPGTSYWIWWRW